jgi:hypothetical protein
MASHERISLKGIHREISAVARKLRAARRRADGSYHDRLDSLSGQLADMQKATLEMCTRTYGVWPPAQPPAPKPPAPTRPKPKPPKKGGTRKPAKKGR